MVQLSGALVNQMRLISLEHDNAILNWFFSRDVVATEAHLSNSVFRFHEACRRHLETCIITTDSPSNRFFNATQMSMDIKPNATDCYGRAFLLHDIVESTIMGSGDEASIASENLSLIASILFYNVGLLYHLKLQIVSQEGSVQNLDVWAVRNYYEKANALLSEYMEQTRGALWTLQAAIWHNLAVSYRSHIVNNRASWVYFEQLDTILGWVPNKTDQEFYARAISMARMQQNACHSATSA